MARYLESSCRKCRRYGTKLFLKGDRCASEKCAFEKRKYAPGQHGNTGRRPKVTDFGIHLVEKQKAKFYYGLMERQFERYYYEASSQRKIPTGERLVQLLELRLDNVIYRLGIAPSRAMSRQIVLHRKVFVNGHYVNIPSYRVKTGDVITFKPELKENVYVKHSMERNLAIPEWLVFDPSAYRAEVVNMPDKSTANAPFNDQLIVEFYSK
jgi:small subunit ribosomal protein S4